MNGFGADLDNRGESDSQNIELDAGQALVREKPSGWHSRPDAICIQEANTARVRSSNISLLTVFWGLGYPEAYVQ